ncbi:MAG: endolytic transglycosylase MltG, partial [Patescibacteria group bacterium]
MKKVFLLLLCLLVIAISSAVAGYLLWDSYSAAPVPSSDRTVSFTIPKNQTASQTISDLHSKQLIKSDLAAKIYLRILGLDQKIKPGAYLVSQSQTLVEVFGILVAGPKDLWVTIPEGFRRQQVAARLGETIPGFDTADFLAKTVSLEGQLFPDT